MLDLNIDAAVSLDSACDETEAHPTTKPTATTFLADDSGASSSVVVADEESNSSSGGTEHTTLKFSILNNTGENHNIIQIVDDDDQDYGDDNDDQVLMTRQLFPVPVPTKNESFSLPMRPQQQWLKLSVPESAVAAVEMGFFNKGQQQNLAGQPHPQQQQVKKSRRGPRSRSSQYRGVTFYRRTGRWESHIWFASELC